MKFIIAGAFTLALVNAAAIKNRVRLADLEEAIDEDIFANFGNAEEHVDPELEPTENVWNAQQPSQYGGSFADPTYYPGNDPYYQQVLGNNTSQPQTSTIELSEEDIADILNQVDEINAQKAQQGSASADNSTITYVTTTPTSDTDQITPTTQFDSAPFSSGSGNRATRTVVVTGSDSNNQGNTVGGRGSNQYSIPPQIFTREIGGDFGYGSNVQQVGGRTNTFAPNQFVSSRGPVGGGMQRMGTPYNVAPTMGRGMGNQVPFGATPYGFSQNQGFDSLYSSGFGGQSFGNQGGFGDRGSVWPQGGFTNNGQNNQFLPQPLNVGYDMYGGGQQGGWGSNQYGMGGGMQQPGSLYSNVRGAGFGSQGFGGPAGFGGPGGFGVQGFGRQMGGFGGDQFSSGGLDF